MARQVEQILRDQIGGLVIDNAVKQSTIEQLQEDLNACIKRQSEKSNIGESGPKAGRPEGTPDDSHN